MIREDRARVIHGMVQDRGRWISLERAEQQQSRLREMIRQGYVQFQGEWIPIDEKLRRLRLEAKSPEQPSQVTVNKTVNRQVYNVSNVTDNRTWNRNRHEHRHIHVDPRQLGAPEGRVIPGEPPPRRLDPRRSPDEALPPADENARLDHRKRKNLPPPEDR